MKIIKPITMTDAILTSSNVPETDTWASGTSYDTGDLVQVSATHKYYQSVQDSNLGNDPATDDGTWWIEFSASNRWKAFDQKLADQVTNAGSITYTIAPDKIVTAIAFFNLSAAEVRVVVKDSGSSTVFDETRSLVDDSDIIDWFTFTTTELDEYQNETIFDGLPGYPGNTIEITVGDGTGTAAVGEIAIGKSVSLGTSLSGTEVGLDSFSTKERDDLGNWTIVSRDTSDPINFKIMIPSSDVDRVIRELKTVRDVPAVYYASAALSSYGVATYGFFQNFRAPVTFEGQSFTNLEIEGLT